MNYETPNLDGMTTEELLAIPRIHFNGTSKSELLEQIEKAYSALGKAYNALREMAPHGRDYYVCNDGMATLRKAEDQHFARLVAIDNIRRELEMLCERIEAHHE